MGSSGSKKSKAGAKSSDAGAGAGAGVERTNTAASITVIDDQARRSGAADEDCYTELERTFLRNVMEVDWGLQKWEDIAGRNARMIELATVQRWVAQHYPALANKTAFVQAYNRTCLLEGNGGDAWVVPGEFPRLLANAFYFHKLYSCMGVGPKAAMQGPKDLPFAEFARVVAHLKVPLDSGTGAAKAEFAKLAGKDGKAVSFARFSDWYIQGAFPDAEVAACTTKFVATRDLHKHIDDRSRSNQKRASMAGGRASLRNNKKGRKSKAPPARASSDAVTFDKKQTIEGEPEMLDLIDDSERMRALWDTISQSYGGNGTVVPAVKLVDVQRWLQQNFPGLDSRKPLAWAYENTHPADFDVGKAKGNQGGEWVVPGEMPTLLFNLVSYNKIFNCFRQFDNDGNNRIDVQEFQCGVGRLGIRIDGDTAAKHSELAAQYDDGLASEEGISFDAFCDWYVAEVTPTRSLNEKAQKFHAERDMDYYFGAQDQGIEIPALE